jgi:hypothetical protein
VAGFEVPAAKLSIYAELLKKLQEQLPVTVTTNGVQTVNGHDIALSFDNAQTLKLRELASSKLPQQVVETGYFTVVREVHEKFHRELLAELQDVNSLTFTDFTLCANRVDDSHVLHTSSEF